MLDIEFDPIGPKYTDYSDYRVNRRLLGPSMCCIYYLCNFIVMTLVMSYLHAMYGLARICQDMNKIPTARDINILQFEAAWMQ